jgi:hypothetical protein
VTSIFSSSSECTIARLSAFRMPNAVITARAIPCIRRMNGHSARMKSSVGFTISSAVASARSSAIHFGASSPRTIWNVVIMVNAMATAMLCAVDSARYAGRNVKAG